MDRPLGFFTLVSLVIHALIILLLPIWSWQGPVKIYPISYGSVTDVYKAPAQQAAPLGSPKMPGTTVKPAKQAAPAPKATPAKPTPETTEAALTPKPQPKPPAVKPSPGKSDTRVITAKEEGEEKLPAPVVPAVKPFEAKEAAPEKEEPPGKAPAGVKAAPDRVSEGADGAAGGSDTPSNGQPEGEAYGTGESLVVSGSPPVYPKGAQNEGVEGEVGLVARVDKDGNLAGVAVAKGSGDNRLDGIARVTIERGWAFKPLGREYSLSVIVAFHGNEVTVKFGGVEFQGGAQRR